MSGKDLSILQPYCENDMKKLKKISKSIFLKFNEPLAKADYDDFYSLANLTFGRRTIPMILIWEFVLKDSSILVYKRNLSQN